MPKNEAKIKFTAETGPFNQAIQKANDEMSQLRAEMKLNETQMKATGNTVEGLENKHKILQGQLDASKDKTEALTQKVNKAVEIFGENSQEASKLRTQLLNAQTAEEKLQQAVNACESELKQQKTAAKEAESGLAQLTGTIESQQDSLDQLKREYMNALIEFGKGSKEAKDLKKAIKDLSGELSDNKAELEDASKQADKLDKSLDNAGKGAKNAEGGFTILSGAIASLAADAIRGAIGMLSEFTSYLAELPSATMEIRQDFATLTTSFDEAGFSADTAKEHWKELYAVFGEDDRAVEASNLIAKMSKDQEDLNDWVKITTGVWATYQDSLPVEGLAEASMETAKVGKITGVLADALNWAGVNEEDFQAKLDACSNEQERQQLITDTLTGLYGEAAETYRETSEAQMEAKRATAEQMEAEMELAKAVEPVTTKFTELKTELLQGLQPAIEGVSDKMLEALEWMEEHPVAMQTIATAVGALAVGLGALAVAAGIYTVAQWAMNSAVLAAVAPFALIAAGIAALIGVGVLLWKNWDEIKAKCIEMKDAVVSKVTELKDKAVEKFNELKDKAVQKVTDFKNNITEKWNSIKANTVAVFTNAKDTVVNAFSSIKTNVENRINQMKTNIANKFDAIKNSITSKIESAKQTLTGIVDKIKGLFNFSWSIPKPKIPKFSVSGGEAPWGFLGKGSLPKISIKWNAEGGILTKPTIFGAIGNTLLGGGEAGHEAILPIDKLEGYVSNAVAKTMQASNIQGLISAVEDLANRPINLNINGRTVATATAGDYDSVNGLRTLFTDRGLILE